jgi:enoyl-CoA hydratase/carnithine racemase
MSAVTVDHAGSVAILTIGNPPLNLVNAEVLNGLTDALERIDATRDVRAVVLTGEGSRAFCAGFDLGEMRHGSGAAEPGADQRLFTAIQDLPVPVVAGIAGHCIGGGLELALACDIRIAAEDATLCAAGVKVGLVVSTARIGSWISPAVASDLVLTGRTIDGREAERLNVVSRAVPSADVLAESRAWAAMIAERAPLAVREAKRAIRATVEKGFDQARSQEVSASAQLTESEDHKRAVAAFLDREPVRFTGR